MEKIIKCISCKREISESGSVTFKCPNCAKHVITRCKYCREIASKYVCPSCNFSGPN